MQFSKESELIVLTDSGIVIDSTEVQPERIRSGMVSIPSGKEIFVALIPFINKSAPLFNGLEKRSKLMLHQFSKLDI